MKHNFPLFAWAFAGVVALGIICSCNTKSVQPSFAPQALKVEQLDLEHLEIGTFLEDWDPNLPLEIKTLDLTKLNSLAVKDSIGCFWIKKIQIPSAVIVSEAVNDTLIKMPKLKGIKISNLLVKLPDPKSGKTVVRRINNLFIRDVFVGELVLSQKIESVVFNEEYKQTLEAAGKAKGKIKAAEKIRAQKAKDSPLHAAKMLAPNLANLDSAVATIILRLKGYKPNGGPVDLNTFKLEIDAINKQTADIVNAITNPGSEVQELKLEFPSAGFQIDIARNGKVLNNYLTDVLTDLKPAQQHKNPITVKVIIAAFADLQSINDAQLKKTLSERFSTECNGDQACFNRLLSKARAEAVKEWFENALKQKNGSGPKIDLVIEASGEGWEVPKTYSGDCLVKDCQDRRIALISRVVF